MLRSFKSEVDILQNVIRQVGTDNENFLKEIRNKRGNPIVPFFVESITRTTVENIYNALNSPEFKKENQNCKNKDNLDVIVQSGGGDADAAYHIAKMLHRKFKGKITYIIPRYAKSAATLLVSGGNSIIMGETSELGPLDPQIPQNNGDYISAKSVQATLDLIKNNIKSNLKLASIIASKINPLVLGEYESTLKIAKQYQKELLFLRMFKDKQEEDVTNIVKKFAEGYTHHSRIIDYEEADNCKLNIEKCDDKEWELIWNFYISYTQLTYLIKVTRILEKTDFNSE